jgi:chorismate mutase
MTLQKLRGEIEAVDRELIRLIKARMEIAARIADEKSAANLPTRDPGRVEVVLGRVCCLAEEEEIDPDPVQDIFRILIRMSEDLQDRKRGQDE